MQATCSGSNYATCSLRQKNMFLSLHLYCNTKKVHHVVAKTIQFTLVAVTIMVLIGYGRNLMRDVRKNNVHTALQSRTQQD
jgi:hypothetical protein